MNTNIKNKIKLVFSVLVCSAILFVAACCYLYTSNPFKITDTSNAKFNPDHFRFEDYIESRCATKKALSQLFPIGTKKDFVDRVLVEAGGASKREVPESLGFGKNHYSYFYTPRHWTTMFSPHTFNIHIAYSETDRIILMELGGDSRRPSAYDYNEECDDLNKK